MIIAWLKTNACGILNEDGKDNEEDEMLNRNNERFLLLFEVQFNKFKKKISLFFSNIFFF